MFKNYFKIALRNILKNKIYSIITIFGLSIGVAYCILTFLYIKNEWTYDQFHTESQNIYRLYGNIKMNKVQYNYSDVATALGPVLKESIPEVENFTRLTSSTGTDWESYHAQFMISEKISDQKFLLTDPSFFEIFSFNFKYGNKNDAFNELRSIILSENAAFKHFGDINPLGKVISIRLDPGIKWEDFLVTGVLEKIPSNSSIKSDFILPYKNYPFFFYDIQTGWNYKFENCNTYIKLAKNTNIHTLNEKLKTIVENYVLRPDSYFDSYEYKLQPLSDIHLNTSVKSHKIHSLEEPKSPLYSYILAGLSLVILTIACINFVHLSLGRASTRTKEIGIRKVVGANRKHIVYQFLGESFFIALISILFGVILAELFLPIFNNFTNKSLVFNLLNFSNLTAIFGLIILIGVLSGGYPSFLISSYHPIRTLRNEIKIGGKSVFSRSLIILQFSFSILLIASTLVMMRQLNFLKSSKTLGFNKENLIVINADQIPDCNRDGTFNEVQKIFSDKIIQHSNIYNVSSTQKDNSWWRHITKVVHDDIGEIEMRQLYIDYNYIDAFQIQLITGRNFSKEIDTRYSGSIIVTESFVKKMKWENPIGQTFKFDKRNSRVLKETNGFGHVIGVVKDFHFMSLYEKVTPTVIFLNPQLNWGNSLWIAKIGSDNVPETLSFIEKTWKELIPGYTLRFSFLDKSIENFYKEDKQWARLITYTAMFAIFIACLGVLGIITLMTTNRTKEIGIRKVCGASVSSIWLLLTQDFIKWIVIATIVGGLTSYQLMSKWLQNFTMHINFNLWTILAAGGFALIIAFAIITFQVRKAATANPVKSLRYE